jgi:dephospho-CoA kinase
MILLGLTGSIGMGKSTTTAMFADLGAVVWNADDVVHRLYASGGAAVEPVGEAFPGVVMDNAVDRTRLAEALGGDETAFRRLEAIVHPLVAQERAVDLDAARAAGAKLAVLDIPLLFETGGDAAVDAVVVVTADAAVQAERVLARPGMTRERFDAILARQMPDAEKRMRADFVIDTGRGLEAARSAVRLVAKTVLDPNWVPVRRGGGFPSSWQVMSAASLAVGIGGRVWRAQRRDGSTVVIKKISAQAMADADHAAAYLNWRDGRGAIRLLRAQDEFQMLEDAGDRTLTSVLDQEGDASATLIAAEVLRRLHDRCDGPFPNLTTMEARFAGLTQLKPAEMDPMQIEALGWLKRLLALPVEARPLHGDLHHDNILSGSRGWLAIDPHGVLGDPAYDAANLLYNPVERDDLRTDTARAGRLAEVMAPSVDRPVAVVLGYAFCHACLSAAWHREDGNEWEAVRSQAVARAIRPLLSEDLVLS